jgi:NAD(P)-dependent dehydrogenase (short-subunit alcohol dehydrogenase family)
MIRQDTTDTLHKQRQIQREQQQLDREADGGKEGTEGTATETDVPQTGHRPYPSRFPAQQLTKPGLEADMALRPQFMAPDYLGSQKLQNFGTLITGGDSGIGRAVAVLFAREGADVAIVYLSSDEDAKETQRHVEAEGRRCLLLRGDVKDDAFCRQAVKDTVDAFGRIDVLVNNAAFQMHAADLADLDDARIFETLNTNVGGYFRMARAALAEMKSGASIINTGSVTGLQGSADLLDYSATKGAIHAMTKALASNVIGRGIRVNAVAPGPVWTPLNPADKTAEDIQTFGQKTDMKRAAQPEELSPAYVFLAAPACSSYITGLVLPVTGSVGAI